MTQRPIGRLTISLCAALGLIIGPALPVLAQTPPAGDPPARVGRLAFLQGTVSTHTADDTGWTPAVINDPFTSGQAFWIESQALAELEVDASILWLDGGTELTIDHLDEQHFAGTETRGETYLDLRNLAPGEIYTVQTPRGLVSITSSGRYDIVAGDTDHPTLVSVYEGRAEVTGPTLVLSVPAGHTATINGTQTYLGSVGPLLQDAFVVAMMEREHPPSSLPRDVPPAVLAMTGAEDLAQYGTWQTVPEYGEVWYPQVDAGWVPYREGHWAFIAPWGWTWVDNAPWGFAPFHYGRWVEHEHRWGWVPADPGAHDLHDRHPVYAPALVTFFGLGAAAAVGGGLAASAAFSHGNVGWLPLGPREAYYPPYHASERYLQHVNTMDVAAASRLNVAQAHEQTIGRLANLAAVSVVPAEILTQSRPVRTALQPARPAEFAAEHPVVAIPPIAPGPTTRGMTPAVARNFGLTPEPHPTAPGPAITRATLPQFGSRPPAPPELRPSGTVPRSTFAPALTPAPLRAEPPRVEIPRLEPPRSEPPRPEPQRAELPRPEITRPEITRPETNRPEVERSEVPRAEVPHPVVRQPAEPPRVEYPHSEPPRAELARPEMQRPAPPPRIEAPRAEAPRPAPPSARPPARPGQQP